ncbi:RNA degradosome polyphosphate kinase [Salipaludibacillus neizhouensis]|uniref:Polyphosphate kinase n=1 Tax=Salipaludibacillus neizhouensis TaxID=885475 RepID=A0A3A9K922_9BACI|nr:RNA degradosome polyphosphate kinase [Salipaludibacillus neizhouensis]RKL68699.1 RNA degradosome polyphosphate kinase [Salipaludibacillus neizhouensis]
MKNKSKRQAVNLDDPLYYNNRELSWLYFNKRVLEEASDTRNPLLERLKFLAIFGTNLDEFFMVRVAGLKDQLKLGFNKLDSTSGMTPNQQLQKISQQSRRLVKSHDQLFKDTLKPILKGEGIQFFNIEDLNATQYNFVSNHFKNYIFPVLTPMAIDAYRPFPILLNKSLNLAVLLEDNSSDTSARLAIVQVPAVLDRTLNIPSSNKNKGFVMLEEVISYFIKELFQGNKVHSVSPFRITRNADLTIQEESASDLLGEIEKELKKRKWGSAVRLEIQKGNMEKKVLLFLLKVLELKQDDVYEVEGSIDLSFLLDFYDQESTYFEHLVYKKLFPQYPAGLSMDDDIFDVVDKKDLFFHHPYESFQPIVDMIAQAATDDRVLAIKQTLYRVSGDSPIIKSLAKAAKFGKQVTVLVEIKARFDEQKNIQWAKKLEKAGCHVIYGLTGLKTHSKITLIITKKNEKIQRYVHLGTGNYNDTTAKFYTDMGILTSKESFGEDATNFFNVLSGYSENPSWRELVLAPFEMRDTFVEMINREIIEHEKNSDGRIIAKMNSLTDKPIIIKLYEASQAGVKIDLIVRGICCLKPGIKNVSENIRVISIVDRFLEHSRVFYFHQNGADKIFLSSADWMTRNMEKRIELLFPVYEGRAKKRIKEVLETTLLDNKKARSLQTDGSYCYVDNNEETKNIQSQHIIYQLAAKNNTTK